MAPAPLMADQPSNVHSNDLVVVGGSAGAQDALVTVCSMLPSAFPAPVLVAVHVPADHRSALPRILDRAGPLTAGHAESGEPLWTGRIYVAPPGHHLVVSPRRRAQLDQGPPRHRHRPAIDPLFASAAEVAGQSAIAVLLSGADADGTDGASTVGAAGGTVVIQRPDDAHHPRMPFEALQRDHPDYVLPADEISAALCRLVGMADGERSSG